MKTKHTFATFAVAACLSLLATTAFAAPEIDRRAAASDTRVKASPAKGAVANFDTNGDGILQASELRAPKLASKADRIN